MSGVFSRIAITILVIAGTVALFMVGFNDWQTSILLKHIEVFYFFGVFFVIFVALTIISMVWES